MLENEGHWLKLMRSAILPADANICLRISGGEILCTVTKDVNKEVELKVTCRIGDKLNNKNENSTIVSKRNFYEYDLPEGGMFNHAIEETVNQNEEMASRAHEKKIRDSPVEKSVEEESESVDVQSKEVICSTRQEASSSGKKHDEGIKSICSEEKLSVERKISLSQDDDRKIASEENGAYKCPLCNFYSAERRTFEKHVQTHRSQSFKRITSQMTNSQSFCDTCSIQFMSVDTYQVHKKYYCKSRFNKDEQPPSPPFTEHSSNVVGAFKPSSDTVILRSGAVDGSVTPSLIQPQAIYAAISTNPLILLPCSLVNGDGLIAQNGVIATGGPGIVLQTGITCPTIVEKSSTMKSKEECPPSRKTSHPIMSFSTDPPEKVLLGSSSIRKRKMSEGDVLNLKKTFPNETAPDIPSTRESTSPVDDLDIPLDLSLKRQKLSTNQLNRSTIKRKYSSTADVECPSPYSSESSSSPRSSTLTTSRVANSPSSSYSNDSIQCYSSKVSMASQKGPQTPPERFSPLPPVLQVDVPSDKSVVSPGLPPPKLMKQGNNVCEECNIVFYKYDNYLAHKKHYCAYRRQQLTAMAAAAAAASAASAQEQSSDDNSNHSGHSQGCSAVDNHKSVLRKVESGDHYRTVISKPSQSAFICDACGVKYSSLDTLNAHQTYYCSKRADSAMSKFVKSRGENGSSTLEPPFSGPEEWKCNFCEATCSSYETIRRHLLTHSELRGFRCLLCGYKGNTLRGMRTHACEHLNENTASIDEFVSSTVISENGIMPSAYRMVDCSDDDSGSPGEQLSSSNRERTISENHRENAQTYEEQNTTDRSQSNEVSYSPKTNDSVYQNNAPNSVSSLKMENRDSSPEANSSSHREKVNPLAFCDVVIKTENDQTLSGDESHEEQPKTFIKSEPEPDSDSDSDGRELILSESPPVQPISVIRCTSDKDRCGDKHKETKLSKRKSRSQNKPNAELKYCKSCDISFYHMSNFVAHKKYYCSRPVPNCLQETTTVQ